MHVFLVSCDNYDKKFMQSYGSVHRKHGVSRRFSSPRTKLLAARCECLHLIKINCLAL